MMTNPFHLQDKLQYTQEQLHTLSEHITDNRELILDTLDIPYTPSKNMFYGACPVHGGDKFNAFNWYNTGNWKCRTHECHRIFTNSALGLVRGILSHSENQWQEEGDSLYSFHKTIEFVGKLLDTNVMNLEESAPTLEKLQFVKRINLLAEPPPTKFLNINRKQIRANLQIPAQYYIDRGYDPKILDKYDVGLCLNPKKEMSYRVVVPIYNEKGQFVGCTGRSPNEECPKCGFYHYNKYACPEDRLAHFYTKWRHSTGLNANNHLYNFHCSKTHIAKSGVAIIVESPGNVWRLEESGIHNAVAVFGTSISPRQKEILDRSGAFSLIVYGDKDDGGQALCDYVKATCKRTYRLYFPKIAQEDIGSMTKDEITQDIKPFIERLR